MVVTRGTTGILKKLVGDVSENINGNASGWGVNDDLKKLHRTLEMILAVIADAEKRQVNEEALRVWLRWLKDIAYDADDVIDEFSYEVMRRSYRKDNWKDKVISFPSSSIAPLAFRLKMAKKIKDINKRLDEITKEMNRFQLQITAPPPDGEITEQLDRKATSRVNESEIVGREFDESHIIKLLTTNPVSSSSLVNPDLYPEKVSVVSIVGIGGLGKTTLAQLVYKDELVKKVFEPLIWVHVSYNFHIEMILVKILESITDTKFSNVSNFDVLVTKVQEKLSGKKYMLVLDDVWNENSEQWERLKCVLLAGAQGSKIIITTRNDQVASVVSGSIPPYNLEQLGEAECWSIIEKKAFSPGGALYSPRMASIGKEITKRCCGLPLAAKFLGSLMYLKNKESDWESIRDDDTWDNIWDTPGGESNFRGVIRLSYDNLPSHLKQCFSYCSIFPRNWEISKETLVHLWMAEGFLCQSDMTNNRSIEDFAHDCFDSLAWGSFFHSFKLNDLRDIETCKMHDLVHDFARDFTRDGELGSVKVSEITNVSEFCRRLRLEMDEDIQSTFSKSVSGMKKLRTLFIPTSSELDPSIFSGNQNLRILHVGGPTVYYPKLPSLSFKLRHLRYLHLSFFDLRELSDPSISELYSLETLVLTFMFGASNLLTDIHSLQKLRYLEISWTDIEELPDSVTSLSNLQTLNLNNSDVKVIPDSISSLKNLRFLNFSFNPIEEFPLSILALSNLETIDVNSCNKLKALPGIVAGLSNLRIFDFKNCPLIEVLPEDFGSLTQLRYLNLDCTGIKVLPESCEELQNLEYVNLFWCEPPKEVTNWKKLRVFEHMQQAETPAGIGELVFLETLWYSVTKERGIEELGHLPFLILLVISDLENVNSPDARRACLKGKHNLRELSLQWGKRSSVVLGSKDYDGRISKVLEDLQPPTSLKMLAIRNFVGRSLPTWVCDPYCLPNLEVLEFEACPSIEQLPASIGQLPCLKHLKLKGMSLKCLDLGGFPSLLMLHLSDMYLLEELRYSSYPHRLKDLTISGCRRLTEIPSFPSLGYLELEKVDPKLVCSVGRCQTSLTQLFMENIGELIYFPIRVLQNNCDLQVLQIGGCNQFEGFGVNDDENEIVASMLGPDFYSGSLQKLGFYDCPVLKFLPDLRGWTSLRELLIHNCPRVKESLIYDLKSLSFLEELNVDFLEIDEQQGDAFSSFLKGELPLSTEGKNELANWIKEFLHSAPELDSSLVEVREKFDLEMERDQSHSKNKWRPTVEQVGILELLYECGLRYPSVQQIQQITKKLREYEKTEELNVYLWFQRYKPEKTSSSLIPTIKEGLKYDSTGKMLPIDFEKQREFLPSVEEHIEVWACHHVRPNIAYIGESPPEIQNQQGTSLPTMSTYVSSTQGDVSQPEGQDNTGDLKKSKLYKLFPCI